MIHYPAADGASAPVGSRVGSGSAVARVPTRELVDRGGRGGDAIMTLRKLTRDAALRRGDGAPATGAPATAAPVDHASRTFPHRLGADGAEAPVAACGGAPDQGTGEARRSGAGSRGSATFRPLRVLRRLPRFRAYPAG